MMLLGCCRRRNCELWKGVWPPLYHQLHCDCCRRYAVPRDGRSWNWYGHSAISLTQTRMPFFLPRLIKPRSKLSSFIIQNNICVDSYRHSAFFFCSEFSVTVMGADASRNMYIIHIIPGYPVEYIKLNILCFYCLTLFSLNDENCAMTIILLHKAEIFLVS